MMRDYTVVGYYTTKIGLESLDIRDCVRSGQRCRVARILTIRNTPTFRRRGPRTRSNQDRELLELDWEFSLTTKVYDAIVVGTGAGGGTAMKVLCEAGLNVLALNSGPRTNPSKGLSPTSAGV